MPSDVEPKPAHVFQDPDAGLIYAGLMQLLSAVGDLRDVVVLSNEVVFALRKEVAELREEVAEIDDDDDSGQVTVVLGPRLADPT